MGGLSHYLETEGLATTHISLIRLHTEKIAPPRALWVPFELGRPLGVPDDPAFQKKVLTAVLRLLEAPEGPVLVDFSEEAPRAAVDEAEIEGLACPINLPPPAREDDLAADLEREIVRLAPWYDRAATERGRTTFGVTGLPIEDVVAYILSYLGDAPAPNPRSDLSPTETLKLACDDLKAYYTDAVTAQPGFGANKVSERWFWDETAAGRTFSALKDRCRGSSDKTLQALATFFLVPRAQQARKNESAPGRP